MLNRLILLIPCFIFLFNGQIYGQLYINEVMPANDSLVFDNYGEDDDWIEIFNAGNTSINLEDYYISDNPLEPLKWKINGPLNIYSGDYILLWADKDLSQGADHLDFKLSGSGETIILTSPDAVTVVDSYTFPIIGLNRSFGRITDGSNFSDIFETSTALADNSNGIIKVNPPILSPEGGIYSSNQTVTITSSTIGASIYYTLDGSEPNITSALYSAPIIVSTTETIRARAFKNGYSESSISTETYTLNFVSTMPIIHLTADPASLWDSTSGIYTIGTNGIDGYCSDSANYVQDWERKAYVEMFNPDGTKSLDHDIGIKISGNCARRLPHKPLALYFRNEYGANGQNEVNEKLFHNKEIDFFKRLYLRKGNSTAHTNLDLMYTDVISNLLVENEMDLETSGSKMTEVFINNQYWGIYDLREKFDQHRFAYQYKYAPDKDSIDIIRNPGRDYPAYAWWAIERTTYGTMNDYYDFENDFMTLDLSIDANYDIIAEQIQMDEMINWLSTGVFLCNRDWIVNNVKYWKYGENGKWRWCVVDFDYVMRLDAVSYDLLSNKVFYTWPNGGNSTVNILYQKLFDNPRFRDEFIQRSATYMNLTWTSSRFDPIVDSLQAVWAPHIARAYNRWENDNSHSFRDAIPDDYSRMDSVLQSYKGFIAQRPAYVKQQFMTRWGMSGMYNLTINTTAASNGHVGVNNVFKEVPHQYIGEYFNDIPLKLLAIPEPGYRFSHWQETGSTNAFIEVTYNSNQTLTPIFVSDIEIVINEIHYHPLLYEAEEFIELYNPSTFSKDLTGYSFEGICYEFPKGFTIQPDEYIIIANDSSLYAGNGYRVRDWKYTSLNNSGEAIRLLNAVGTIVDSVHFDDNLPWNKEADGEDYSLALTDYMLDNALASSWNIQLVDFITPGAENFFCPNITVSQSVSQPLCPNVNDGGASIALSAGNAGYTFSWSHGPIGSSVNGLSPGNYVLTIMDVYGCELTDTIIINAPTTILAANLVKTEESVLGAADGNINLSTSIVNATSYLWSNGATTEDINGLSAGTYSVEITDVNGCVTTKSIVLNPGPQLPIASASFTPNNGVAPINISFNAQGSFDPDGSIIGYTWNFGDGNTGTGANPTHNYSTPGTYTVTLIVTDSQGLTDTILLTVNVIDTCDPPTNLTLLTASASTLIVSWTGDPQATNYNLRYREASVGGAWTNFPTTGTTAIITGLNDCSDYEVKVSNQCNFNLQSGYSATSIFSTTNCFVCTAPLGLYQFNIQNISAIITWDVLVGATSYTYKFRKIGDQNWISQTTTFPIAVLFGISGCTDYEWTMETTCADGSTAQSGTINNFTTQCKNEVDAQLIGSSEDIRIYPNPATSRLNISYPEWDSELNYSIQILDLSGKVVKTIVEPSATEINISDLQSGTYFVRWNSGTQSFVETFTKVN